MTHPVYVAPLERRYRINSWAVLPERMSGAFPFAIAYQLVCEWNSRHDAAMMAWPERVEA